MNAVEAIERSASWVWVWMWMWMWMWVWALACAPEPSPERPHVLIVTLDTTRVDYLSVYGYDLPTTPCLERLARDATLFTRARSTSSWTLPAHASLFTGKFPPSHGARAGPRAEGPARAFRRRPARARRRWPRGRGGRRDPRGSGGDGLPRVRGRLSCSCAVQIPQSGRVSTTLIVRYSVTMIA